MNNTQAAKLVQSYRDTQSKVVPLCTSLYFNKESQLHQVIVGLYGTVLELSNDTLLLIEQKRGTSLPVVLRTMTEATIDLLNTVRDDQFVRGYELSYLKEWMKVVRAAQSKDNPYLVGLTDLPNFAQQSAVWEGRRKQLVDEGVTLPGWDEKFSVLGRKNEYDAVYNQLCCDSHSNFRSIIERHFAMAADARDMQVVFFKTYELADVVELIAYAEQLLLDASLAVHRYFKSKSLGELESLKAAARAKRESLNA